MYVKKSIQNISFYIFWTILIVGKGWGLTSGDIIYIYMIWGAIPFAIIKLLATKWTKKELITCVLLNILGIIIWLSAGDTAALLLIISVTSLKGIDIEQLIGYSLLIKATLFIIKISFALLGIIDKQLLIRYDLGDIHTVRYSLGYNYPNVTHAMFFVVVMLIILKYKYKIKQLHYMIMFLANIWLYTYTNSRTGFFVTSILIILVWCVSTNRFNYIVKPIIYISDKCYIIEAITSLFICIAFSKIDVLATLGTLTGRITSAINIINNHSFPLFGFDNIVTDWGYIDILYENGIIFTCLFLIAVTRLMKLFKKDNDKYSLMVFVAISIYTLAESYFASILVNTALVYFGKMLYPKNNKKLEKKNANT